jgi:hypothetical protein
VGFNFSTSSWHSYCTVKCWDWEVLKREKKLTIIFHGSDFPPSSTDSFYFPAKSHSVRKGPEGRRCDQWSLATADFRLTWVEFFLIPCTWTKGTFQLFQNSGPQLRKKNEDTCVAFSITYLLLTELNIGIWASVR